MQCAKCRTTNREGRRFCGECGAPLSLACPQCSFLNEPGEKFCGGCGQPLLSPRQGRPKFVAPESYTPKHLAEKILTSKAALEGERKQVTVLFADLKGSMELLADRDPEEARKLLVEGLPASRILLLVNYRPEYHTSASASSSGALASVIKRKSTSPPPRRCTARWTCDSGSRRWRRRCGSWHETRCARRMPGLTQIRGRRRPGPRPSP